MRKYLLFLFLIAFFYANLSAQVSGYMGKRFLLEAQPISAFNWYSIALLDEDPKFSISPGLHAEYAISRNNSISCDYQFSSVRQTFTFPIKQVSGNIYNVRYFNNVRVTGHTVAFNIRHYYVRREDYWGLAPLGTFVGIGIGHYFGLRANTNSSPIKYDAPTDVKNTFVKVEIGSRNVLFGKVTLNYSVGLASLTNRSAPTFINAGNTNYAIIFLDEHNRNEMSNGLRFANSFTANVGIGIFLF